MDERRHHPQPGNGHPQLDPNGYAPGSYDGGGHTAPWPGHAMPAHQAGAPIQGHAPHHAPLPPHVAQPSMQQFQYAGGGFVLPGAPQGQSPMSAHGGMIGVPQAQQPPHQYAASAPGALPSPSHAGGSTDPYARPQAWAFATPNGMQLVQPGSAAVHVAPVEWAPPADAEETAAVAAPAAMRSRLRWETIIPVGALVCFLAAVAVFVSDFDRMTGRDAATGSSAGSSTPAATDAAPAAAADPTDPAQAVAQAAALYRQGRFEQAAKLLYPVVSVASPNAKAVALYDRAGAAGKRNAALLAAMARHRKAARWTAVIRTIGQLEQLRPLTPSMVKLRATARAKVRAANALSKARSLARQGRYTAAMAVVDTALKAGPNAQLLQLREQISARSAAPSTASTSGTGGGGRGSAPPVSGGQRPAGGSAPVAQPPSDIPSGTMPPRPDAPNPNNGATGGGVTGAMEPGANHEGMAM